MLPGVPRRFGNHAPWWTHGWHFDVAASNRRAYFIPVRRWYAEPQLRRRDEL